MSESAPTKFGEYLKQIRLERHISLTKAAKSMGMSVQKLCDIESGRRYNKRISLNTVQKVSAAYEISIAEIIKNTETAVHSEKTISDILVELLPSSRLSELLAKEALNMSKAYSPELERVCSELYEHIRNVHVLANLMQKRHFNSEK